jgi:5,10-methylene-tetrahydrofolate dehydrogenase/methenyl tetrahydrofolate cyclohydrolase
VPLVPGILVQLPLPKHINEEKILSEVSIEKDVDGFHPLNIGKLAMKGREPLFVPCTPKVSRQSAKRSQFLIATIHLAIVRLIVGSPL